MASGVMKAGSVEEPLGISSAAAKVEEKQEAWILELRKERRLGVRRIQHEIERQHDFHLSHCHGP